MKQRTRCHFEVNTNTNDSNRCKIVMKRFVMNLICTRTHSLLVTFTSVFILGCKFPNENLLGPQSLTLGSEQTIGGSEVTTGGAWSS